MKKHAGQLIYSPSDLVRYFASPFASWMDRYHLENPGAVTPDQQSAEQELVAECGNEHEQALLNQFRASTSGLIEMARDAAPDATLQAIQSRAPVIYQAALADDRFAGFADFLQLDGAGYQVWDTKLARSTKPYFTVQLCCYSEMLAALIGQMPEKFGVILGTGERVEFRVEDYIHFYRRLKTGFLRMQDGFTGNLADRPEPLPRADHGRWASHAEKFFEDTDHLVRVAGITVGQIKKLHVAGINTMVELANSAGKPVPKLPAESLEKLVAQARLQCQTRADRIAKPDAPPCYELLPGTGPNGEPAGLASLPPAHPADVFFDMEGYPLAAGGLEYLFGVCIRDDGAALAFKDWWAHNREEEKRAFEGFVDFVFQRWKANPGMHVYHYAAYEVSAVRRLSTRHDTRQIEVDHLLRNNVFVDLYQIVRKGLRIGEDSYSIKAVERLYRPARQTGVATAGESIVEYARWLESGQPPDWRSSDILKAIRDYNEDDCRSTAELFDWLTNVAANSPLPASNAPAPLLPVAEKELSPDAAQRLELAAALREQTDSVAAVLADLVDFHRREDKPMWWRMFDRAQAAPEELRDDPGCVEGVREIGAPVPVERSLVQTYQFDPSQECKLAAGKDSKVMFTHNLDAQLTVAALDIETGELRLKISKNALNKKLCGAFPNQGSVIQAEYVPAESIQAALSQVAERHLSGKLHKPAAALLKRVPPQRLLHNKEESVLDAAIRVTAAMNGECLVVQGPPGTGKTYTAARVINALLAAGKKVGITSNSHKAIHNLIRACGDASRKTGETLRGIVVGGEPEAALLDENSGLKHVEKGPDGRAAYSSGVVGGTAWLFTRPEWEGVLDFLFIDEAGQVCLANAVAMSRCACNLVLLGDQMQLEQPVEGVHPGDSGLSVLQYALKDTTASKPDAPVFHAVVPASFGLFLGETRRMHPGVCQFISDSIYDGRLRSHPDCARQKITLSVRLNSLVSREAGILFTPVEHDGNIQRSDEEVERVKAIYHELLGCEYTACDGATRRLSLRDFLFIAPYNAQVRALQAALPDGARVGSVDKFQGQEAPVCILSLCSSFGEYGSRGLGFILDRNRLNVAISRAQCLAVVVADPRIASGAAGSLNEIKLLNLFCKLLDSGGAPPPTRLAREAPGCRVHAQVEK